MSLNALYVDFNSYFASVEQQLIPALRHKPIAVLPVMAETTCCIAASYEAKALGIKTGTMVREARQRCKDIIFVEARPEVYVQYHHKLIEIVESCTHVEKVLSIDEMVCQLTGSQQQQENALSLAATIKQRIQEQYDYIKCSIGHAAWGSIEGEHLYDKLRGLEPYYEHNKRSSLGHSHVLPPEHRNIDGAKAVLHKLLQKATMRLRSYGLLTTHISIKIKFQDKTSYKQESKVSANDNVLTLTSALEELLKPLTYLSHNTPTAVSIQLSGLHNQSESSLDLFSQKTVEHSGKLNKALDQLNLKYGKNTIYLGGAHKALTDAPMRIAFQHIPDLVIENDV